MKKIFSSVFKLLFFNLVLYEVFKVAILAFGISKETLMVPLVQMPLNDYLLWIFGSFFTGFFFYKFFNYSQLVMASLLTSLFIPCGYLTGLIVIRVLNGKWPDSGFIIKTSQFFLAYLFIYFSAPLIGRILADGLARMIKKK